MPLSPPTSPPLSTTYLGSPGGGRFGGRVLCWSGQHGADGGTWGSDFEGQACLSLAEAAAVLKEAEERRAAPGTEQQLHPSTRKALRYAERFRRGEEAGAAQARKALEAAGLRPFEAGALATLAPETAEVAMALQPSIELGPEELQSSLDQLAANLTYS